MLRSPINDDRSDNISLSGSKVSIWRRKFQNQGGDATVQIITLSNPHDGTACTTTTTALRRTIRAALLLTSSVRSREGNRTDQQKRTGACSSRNPNHHWGMGTNHLFKVELSYHDPISFVSHNSTCDLVRTYTWP
jgi:hypothetical protein